MVKSFLAKCLFWGTSVVALLGSSGCMHTIRAANEGMIVHVRRAVGIQVVNCLLDLGEARYSCKVNHRTPCKIYHEEALAACSPYLPYTEQGTDELADGYNRTHQN